MIPDQSKHLTIAQRLRIIHCSLDDLQHCGNCLPCQAADEIERLNHENLSLRHALSKQNKLNRMTNILEADRD
jgi:hypothetical protein